MGRPPKHDGAGNGRDEPVTKGEIWKLAVVQILSTVGALVILVITQFWTSSNDREAKAAELRQRSYSRLRGLLTVLPQAVANEEQREAEINAAEAEIVVLHRAEYESKRLALVQNDDQLLDKEMAARQAMGETLGDARVGFAKMPEVIKLIDALEEASTKKGATPGFSTLGLKTDDDIKGARLLEAQIVVKRANEKLYEPIERLLAEMKKSL